MRLGLKLQIDRGNVLTYNYQYPLSAFIYKTIAKADQDFATFLHDEGYQLKGKRFKHFTFSKLDFGRGGIKPIPKSDRFYVNTREIHLELRFFMPKAAEAFIVGLFNRQEFGLGDKLNRIDCHVGRVETMPDPEFTNGKAVFKTNSPILLSVPRENAPAKYLHPKHDENYDDVFLENLKNKWLSLGKPLAEGDLQFKLLDGHIKKQGLKVKAFTDEETQLIPYHCAFELSAPSELLKLGYLSGFGLEGSMGLGCCEILEEP